MSSYKRIHFGTDGIRGKALEHPLTPEFMEKLAKAVVEVVVSDKTEQLSCFIIRDTRSSGEVLENGLVKGFQSSGFKIYLGGILPTPAAPIVGKELGVDLSVVISASHNPSEDNGIKFFKGDGNKLSDEEEFKVEKLLDSNLLSNSPSDSIVHNHSEALETYVSHATNTYKGDSLSGVSIALDAANGASYESTPEALTRLGADVTVFYDKPDGHNINLDCGCTHPKVIESLVLENKANVGISHDGDADRVLLTDEKGSTLDGDEIMGIVALDMIQEGTLNKNTLVVTSMSNAGLGEAVELAGGKVVKTDIGDRYVSLEMKTHGYNFGGEQSGHFIFSDHAPTGDGLISALQVLHIINKTKKPLSILRTQIQKFPQILKNVKVPSKPPLEELVQTNEYITTVTEELKGKGRVLLRYSGTEQLLRILVEGKEIEKVKSIASQIEDISLSEIKTLTS